jgi:ATP-binding cassette subfamily B protein
MSRALDGDPPRLVVSARAAVAAAWRVGRVLLTVQVLLTVAEALTPVALAWLTKLVIDGLTSGPEAAGRQGAGLTGAALALAGVGVAAAVLPLVGGYLGGEIGRRFTVDATDRLFAALIRLPGLRPFENPAFLDRLRLAQGATASGGSLLTDAITAGRVLLTTTAFVGALLVISPTMTVIVIASSIPMLLVNMRLSRARARLAWTLSPVERWQFFYSDLMSRVDAAREIRLFGSGQFLRHRMMAYLRLATTARRRMDKRELAAECWLALFGAIVAGCGLIWVVNAARRGTLTPGDVTMFVAAVAAVNASLYSLVSSVAGIYRALLLFGHYIAVTCAQPDLAVPTQPRSLPPLCHGIELRNVWFRYNEDLPWVLRGVNLLIPANRSVAVVGLNGAGKSTLVKLLCRFYDPDRGTILWDGVDIRDVPPEQLRRQITAVFQDPVSYDLSARDNIALGDVAAHNDLERVRAAASRAGVDETLDALPRGYNTLLTRSFLDDEDDRDAATGVMLSGGQWQRVALARCFFRTRRDIVIVDEPTAGLDPEAESHLHDTLRRHRAGSTSLLISNRLNTVRDADLLVVLRDGVVQERGDHEALMNARGEYARLFRLQAAGYQLDQADGVREEVKQV